MTPRTRYRADILPTGIRRPVVFWNLTDRCNLTCSNSYSRSAPDRDTSEELLIPEALALIDDFSAMGGPLILFSGGEPLLRKNIWDLASHARDMTVYQTLQSTKRFYSGDSRDPRGWKPSSAGCDNAPGDQDCRLSRPDIPFLRLYLVLRCSNPVNYAVLVPVCGPIPPAVKGDNFLRVRPLVPVCREKGERF